MKLVKTKKRKLKPSVKNKARSRKDHPRGPAPAGRAWEAASDQEQKRMLEAALQQTEGNMARAARGLNLARTYFITLLHRFDLLERSRELRQLAWGRLHGRPPIY